MQSSVLETKFTVNLNYDLSWKLTNFKSGCDRELKRKCDKFCEEKLLNSKIFIDENIASKFE